MATFSGRLGRVVGAALAPSIAMCVFSMTMLAFPSVNGQQFYEQFDEYDLAMNDRPSLGWGTEVKYGYVDGLTELWSTALDRPDAELQRLVVDTLAIAKRRGIDGIDDLKPRLVELLERPDQPIDVLRAVSQTLIVFDARDQAPALAELAQRYGAPIGQIVEPALARWKSDLLESTWLERLSGPATGSSMMSLAIEGLVSIESADAVEPLQRIVQNFGQPSPLRMAAARGLAKLQTEGLVELAADLAKQPSRPAALNPILAVQLLRGHSGPETIEFLVSLLDEDTESLVQSESLEQLYRLDPATIDQFRDRLVRSRDVNVRRWCLKAMIDSKQADRVPVIASLLGDINPGLRRDVAAALIDLARNAGFEDTVIEESSKVLNQDTWLGCEQACVVLTRLDHKPSGRRMVELLGHQRGEVQVAAAWGLSKLRIEELLPDMLDHAQSIYDGFRSGQLNDDMPGKAMHLAHLFIAFGDQGYRPAEPLLRSYLPKNHSLGMDSRAAAAWAIGIFYEEDEQPDLVELFIGRLRDNGIYPDTDAMRDQCAIALGRMKAESALSDLRAFAKYGMASCYWAIQQITGEEPPEQSQDVTPVDDWFLTPFTESSD